VQSPGGSRGTWQAAVAAVATAVTGVDMVVYGECTNAFCITRPPGHHAGRSLHSMDAVSNGFCILNTVACAAIHATSPISQGGLGLSRVCVIDFDVHHGNGTQDILCNTFDPRFLYVSMHAGGSQVNGIHGADDAEVDYPRFAKQLGIYPGRCGDTSPHPGVVNVPLGAKVESHAIGLAMVNRVTPAVSKFSPDLIILSAGFDAHKHDPMNLGSLSALDFGLITEVACQLAWKHCSGRVLSVLEGGYGVPCCRPQINLFQKNEATPVEAAAPNTLSCQPDDSMPSEPIEAQPQLAELPRPQPLRLLDLGDDIPDDMDDQVPYGLQRNLEKCHSEGFVECVKDHVAALLRCGSKPTEQSG
jgi:acetoin utilization deacetylase AcuC-like enzyme